MAMTDDMWGTGDYRAVAEKVMSIADVLVPRAGIEPGMAVLDVACGTGNASIPAARLGARVCGLDFSPGLIAIARQRGADANVEIDWREGDAQSLPFNDDSFDRVISAIGEMFKRLGAISAAPPEGSQPPVLWGTEEHVRELLGDSVGFERHNVDFDEPSPESYAEFMLTSFPPLIAMRAELGDELVRETYRGWVNDVNEADDGTLRYRGEYLVSVT
jgi:hypothetical protein